MLGLTLASDLYDFLSAPPDGAASCAEQWATIIRDFTDAIVPAVDPATQDLAKTAFQALLSTMTPATALAVFDSAFAAYASALAAAMPPAPGTPPPLLLSVTLAPVAALNMERNKVDAVDAIAVVIDAWFRTGVSSTAVPWS